MRAMEASSKKERDMSCFRDERMSAEPSVVAPLPLGCFPVNEMVRRQCQLRRKAVGIF